MNRERCRAALDGGRGDGIDWLGDHRGPGLQATGKVVRRRQIGDQVSTETAYDLLGSALSPERPNEVVRWHWGIEAGSAGGSTSS